MAFPVLSDPGNNYAGKLGLKFSLPEDLREVYSGFGIVLPEANGDDSWTLPLPTRIVVDAAGAVVRVDTDPDYTVRPEPGTSVDALKHL